VLAALFTQRARRKVGSLRLGIWFMDRQIGK
jgi:hypothetical protein